MCRRSCSNTCSNRTNGTSTQRQAAAGDPPLAGVLPVPPTPLLGREREAGAIEDLVAGEGVWLVTLTGSGGVGKSRLMVEAARRLGPGFADGAVRRAGRGVRGGPGGARDRRGARIEHAEIGPASGPGQRARPAGPAPSR